jgi:hypothetical protein
MPLGKSSNKPKPFQRPGIDLDSAAGTVQRVWLTVPASTLVKGDLVVDFGLLTKVQTYDGYLGQDVLRLTNVTGEVHDLAPSIEVFAFVTPRA